MDLSSYLWTDLVTDYEYELERKNIKQERKRQLLKKIRRQRQSGIE